MEFVARSPMNKPEVLEVRYECSCGCKPRARYAKGTQEAGHEHCCCGRVHFVGPEAVGKLNVYLAERRAKGEDAGLKYTVTAVEVTAPWGEVVPVAFAEPDKLKMH